ncbi:MAG: metal ABC transporter permease [Verrucomicrobiota bacterium]
MNLLDFWIMVTGIAVALACVIPGVLLVLTRQSMLGDGISHAVLPGLALAFLLSGSRDMIWMLTGACLAGLFTSGLSYLIVRFGNVDPGAALGVTFCSLFASGLILIRFASDKVDLDPNCVLYGTVETAVVDGVINGTIPRVAWQAILLLLLNLSVLFFFYKELVMLTFDSGFAKSKGYPVGWMNVGITLITAITTVLCFEAVGSILVIAFLSIPVATALLISKRLVSIFWISGLVGIAASITGHLMAVFGIPGMVNYFSSGALVIRSLSSSGTMVAMAGVLFLTTLLMSRLFRLYPNSQMRTVKED